MRYVLWFVYAFAVCALGGGNQLKPIPSHSVTQAVRAFQLLTDGNTEETKIQARSVMLDATMPSGAARKTNLFVLFDPVGGFYQWLFGVAYDIEQPTDFGMFNSGGSSGVYNQEKFNSVPGGRPYPWRAGIACAC